MYGLLIIDVENYDPLITNHMGHEAKHRIQYIQKVARKLYHYQSEQAFRAGQ